MNRIFVHSSMLNLDSNYTGISWYVYNILKNFKLEYRNLITLFDPFDAQLPTFDNTYNTYNLNIKRKLGNIKFYEFGSYKINKMDIDTYWAPSFIFPRFISSKIKIILTVHDITFLDNVENNLYHKIKNQFLYLPNIKYSIKRANTLTVLSYSVANKIKDIFKVNENDIKIVSPAYDKNLFKPFHSAREKFNEKFQIKSKFVLIGNMLHPRKNFDLVIKAFKKVKKNGVLCAFGALTNSQVEFANRELGNRFKYLGYVDENDLPVVYSAANAFIAPSKMEGFDMPTLEARACGTYVIASDIPVHREVLENEVDYFSVDDVNKLSKLISDSLATDKEIIESKIINKYDWRKSADEMLRILGLVKNENSD